VIDSVCNQKDGIEVWTVFNFERGKRYDEITFDTEEKACNYLLDKLIKHQELVDKFKLKD